jgi:glycerophosphoryl diester phosphodiesterase
MNEDPGPIRIGHKGADALVPGNTVASFERAVEVGVDLIEFDVLWLPDGRPGAPKSRRSPLVVAHDWHAAREAMPPTLEEVLDAFRRPPLDRVRINLDLKLPGREYEVVEALDAAGLTARASVSTMEVSTLKVIGDLDPSIHRGWTVPRVTRDWTAKAWLKPALLAGLVAARRRLPEVVRRGLPDLGVESVWAYFGVVTPALLGVTRAAGIDLNAWTVDDPERVRALTTMGVSGICSNDPRLLNRS